MAASAAVGVVTEPLLHLHLGVLVLLGEFVRIAGRGHEGEDPVQGYAAEEGYAVDVAPGEFTREGEEGAVGADVDESAPEVGVVHYVRGGAGNRVEDCLGLWGMLVRVWEGKIHGVAVMGAVMCGLYFLG